jgi:hypothetical protein
MKTRILVIALFFVTGITCAQENMLTISGGYSFTNIEDVDLSTSGWRINGTYEFNKQEGHMAHGFSIGYISTTATGTATLFNQTQEADFEVSSLPMYYAPKYLLGKGPLKGFVKGALGWQFSNYKASGSITGSSVEASDSGFMGGLGLGAMFNFTEKIFINVEYEWTYMNNSYYKDDFMNSVMGGLGFRF